MEIALYKLSLLLCFLATNVATLYFASVCMGLSCTNLKFGK